MNFLQMLDKFIEDALQLGFSDEQIGRRFLEEDCILYEGDDVIPLLEAVHRVRRTISGVRITTRKYGRVDPRRRQRAIRAAREHRAKRLMAARKYQRSPKARLVRRVVKQRRMMKHHPGATRRHTGPRMPRRRR